MFYSQSTQSVCSKPFVYSPVPHLRLGQHIFFFCKFNCRRWVRKDASASSLVRKSYSWRGPIRNAGHGHQGNLLVIEPNQICHLTNCQQHFTIPDLHGH